MEKGIGTDKKKMIEELRGRLNWFVNEASEEEYNDEEVKAIRKLLDVMEPEELDESYYNAEKALERFKATLEIRMRIQDEMRRFQAGEVSLADYPDDDEIGDDDTEDDRTSGDNFGCGGLGGDVVGKVDETLDDRKAAEEKATNAKTRSFFRSSGMYRGVIAAALVLALFVGGTVGAYAQKNGFFQWVKRDKDGMSVMTSPDGMDNNVEGNNYYYSLSEVPEEYRQYIWEPEQIPQGMEFVYYGTMKYKDWDRVLCYYYDDEQNARLEFISRIFAQGIEYHSQQFDSYDFLYSKEYKATTLEFYEKDSEDEKEYAVSFLHDNVQYIVQGEMAIEKIEELADEYCDAVIK